MTHPLDLWKSFALTHIYSFPHTSKNTVLTPSLSFATHSAPVTQSPSRWRAEDLTCQDGTPAFLLLPLWLRSVLLKREEGKEESGKRASGTNKNGSKSWRKNTASKEGTDVRRQARISKRGMVPGKKGDILWKYGAKSDLIKSHGWKKSTCVKFGKWVHHWAFYTCI